MERDGDKVVIRLGQQDSFGSGSADLSQNFEPTLRKVGSAIQSVGGVIRVEGHTDNVPVGFSERFRSNWDLSAARSASVANYLIDNTNLEREGSPYPDLLTVNRLLQTTQPKAG